MAYINPDVYDMALNAISGSAENLYVCSQEPTTFTQASATYSLGSKVSPSFTGPSAGDVSGRKITVSAISDGSVSSSGNACWVSLTDDSLSKLLAAQVLSASQTLTSGNTFSLTAFDVEIQDPS